MSNIKYDNILDIAHILNQLSDNDQREIIRHMERMYKNIVTYGEDEYNLDAIIPILNKLVFEEQQQVVEFFRQLYDPDVLLDLDEDGYIN